MRPPENRFLSRRTARWCLGGSWLAAALAVNPAAAQSSAPNPAVPSPGSPGPAATDARLERLRQMSLEEVLHADVTSVSKKPESRFEAAAAVAVITSEDIQRTGARTFAEALRLAPGLSVASLDANKWAVASRGFADRWGNRLLVLIDGRTVFSPSHSGVFWEIEDYLPEDIERIEVVRGPGGTLWGGNAMNGVINIVTKSARDSQGTYVTAGGGTAERGFGGVRYGARLSDNTSARVYGTYRNTADHPDGFDGWEQWQGGFRLDRTTEANNLTFQGDVYHSLQRHQQTLVYLLPAPGTTPPQYLVTERETYSADGANLLGRYTHQWSEDTELQIQAYADRMERGEQTYSFTQDLYDIELQQRFPLPGRQSVVGGVGYRYLPDHYDNLLPDFIRYEPAVRHRQLFSAFLQDEITLIEDRLKFTLGSKLEWSDLSDWQVQPNARLAWTPTSRQTVWGAVSRAVTQPGRNSRDISLLVPVEPTEVNGLPMFVRGLADEVSANPQAMIGYELGYRNQWAENWSFDLTGFYNDYTALLMPYFGTPEFVATPQPHLELPVRSLSTGRGTAVGGELSVEWRVTDAWRVSGAYSFLDLQLTRVSEGSEGRDPQHQVSLRSSHDLPRHFYLDFWGRYVSRLDAFNLDAYFDLDVRLAWRPSPKVELAVVGQNLIESRRFEFGPNDYLRTALTAVPRGVYGQLTLRF